MRNFENSCLLLPKCTVRSRCEWCSASRPNRSCELQRIPKAELIVMGAKARKSLAGNVPHTKAYRVVCAAQCPVLTIRS